MPLEPRTLLTFFPERTVAEPSSEMQSTTRGLLVAALILLPSRLEAQQRFATSLIQVQQGGGGGLFDPPRMLGGPVGAGLGGGSLDVHSLGVGGSATLEATLDGDSLTGTLSLGPMGSQQVSGTRTSKKPGAAAKAAPARRKKAENDDGRPKPPKTDQNLESMRAVLEGRATLVVRTNRAPAIQGVVELLEKEKVSYALTGADDLLDDGALLGGKKPAIVVGPEVVVEDDGALVNVAATFADHDLPIMFGTGNCAGTRFLPMHAAYAVRYGLSPQDALQALTMWPAEAFHLDHRIGSLQKGKDGDMVVFSGNPFEPMSKVLLVVCNGRVVVDNREQAQ